MPAPRISLEIPDDEKLLNALGRLAVAHGNLELVQIMCLKTLEHLDAGSALKKYRRKRSADIREKIKKLVQARIDVKITVHVKKQEKLLRTLHVAKLQSERRNQLLHRFWGKDKHGYWQTSSDQSVWEPPPAILEINLLVRAIQKTAYSLNKTRFRDGLLAELSKSV